MVPVFSSPYSVIRACRRICACSVGCHFVGSPLTNAGKTIERFRRPNYGTLEVDITVDDPKAYTRPWTVRVNQRIMPDTDLIEFICLENQQFTEYLRRQQ